MMNIFQLIENENIIKKLNASIHSKVTIISGLKPEYFLRGAHLGLRVSTFPLHRISSLKCYFPKGAQPTHATGPKHWQFILSV